MLYNGEKVKSSLGTYTLNALQPVGGDEGGEGGKDALGVEDDLGAKFELVAPREARIFLDAVFYGATGYFVVGEGKDGYGSFPWLSVWCWRWLWG